MFITVSLVVLGALTTLIGIEMVHNPPKTNAHRWFWRGSWVAIGVCVLLLTVFQRRQSNKDETLAKQQIANLQTNLVDVNHTTSNLYAQYQSLYRQYQNLEDVLATSPALNPQTREMILKSNQVFEAVSPEDIDLATWKIKLKEARERQDKIEKIQQEEEHKRNLEQTRNSWEQCLPRYSETVEVLAAILNAQAMVKHDKATISRQPIPSFLPYDAPGFTIAEIKFEKDERWTFRVDIKERDSMNRRNIQVVSKNCLLDIMWHDPPNFFGTWLHVPGRPEIDDTQQPIDSYKKNIQNVLMTMVAFQDDAIEVKTNSP